MVDPQLIVGAVVGGLVGVVVALDGWTAEPISDSSSIGPQRKDVAEGPRAKAIAYLASGRRRLISAR